ncbi:ClpXP protease specificity-enhancing factor [Vibrio navarrensis]|uniref:ClpXP protease specificity-enhancing factor n=1 Tax=Vibrio navarrensis TaxID=29495 RepID=A0A099LRS6_9VIBR|nr:ClpXP protease specificity-enhancing factor [Vibrio navarrensis]ELV8623841.1 ClpXP protease specificity-enhancing factor [Vibrio cidicii]EJL6395326.1 ClpXP protease specificity-enhancing factor [Vibrio navarrensis]EJL6398947.1 ClpXP protease specificity-enhancing factor [Vibrio navarrensis]EJL6567112.1 ClpXP protease specificity-enhancing factor [Vibrio navarrensis]EKA5634679.1 ClpXP protease specificity-enhancing factor [Vibrio navarrensis]
MEIANMTARRPYMLRAFYDWLVDNDLTPHLVVQATMPGVRVPLEFVQDGQIILNIAPRAVGQLELGNEAISFHARFSGRPHSVIVPLHAVLAIYARENGAGTMFEPEEAYTNVTGEIEEEWLDDVDDSELSLDDLDSDTASTENSNAEPTRPKGKPSLRVVK